MRTLLAILNPRNMREPLESFKKLKVDKLYVKNLPEQEGYTLLRNFFLEHKEYTHLALISDDASVYFPETVIETMELFIKNYDYPVFTGVCNIDNEPENKGKWAVTWNVPDPSWKTGKRYYDFLYEKDYVKDQVVKVGFSGFPLMFIRRDVVEQIPFRDDREFNGDKTGYAMDVMFCYDCNKLNIPIWVYTGIRLNHLKGQEGSDKIDVEKRGAYLIHHDNSTHTNRYYYIRGPKKAKLVVDIIVYNEEANIEDCLHSLEKIPDIDEVYIVDGTWMYSHDVKSSDRTKEICQNFRSGVFEVKYVNGWKKWKNESEKRNYCYSWAEQSNTEYDVWHFTVDADEEIILPKGKKYLPLKPLLENIKEDFVMLESGPHDFAIDHPLQYFQVRLWRGSRGIHWHDGQPMVLHDGEHNPVMDWGKHLLHQPVHWMKDMMVLNKWFLRDKGRLESTQKALKEIKYEERCSYTVNAKPNIC